MEHEERNIQHYVEVEDPGAVVTLVQRIITTKILRREFEVWDVHTENNRYWVITNLNYLYDQARFPSYDEALTLHIGLMARMNEQYRTDLDEEAQGHVAIPWRKYEQAVDAFDVADEAEAFQSVGIHCREALIALGRELAKVVPDDAPAPKGSDFKGWTEQASEILATRRARAYLKCIAESAWNLTAWLEHYDDATIWYAELVLDATSHVISTFGVAVHRREQGQPPRCPRCSSYKVDRDSRYDRDTDTASENKVCGACEHEWDFKKLRFAGPGEGWVEITDGGAPTD